MAHRVCVICGGSLHRNLKPWQRFCGYCWNSYVHENQLPRWMRELEKDRPKLTDPRNGKEYGFEYGETRTIRHAGTINGLVTGYRNQRGRELNHGVPDTKARPAYVDTRKRRKHRIRVDCYDSEGTLLDTRIYSPETDIEHCRQYWHERYPHAKVYELEEETNYRELHHINYRRVDRFAGNEEGLGAATDGSGVPVRIADVTPWHVQSPKRYGTNRRAGGGPTNPTYTAGDGMERALEWRTIENQAPAISERDMTPADVGRALREWDRLTVIDTNTSIERVILAVAIQQEIERLPLKYRNVANGLRGFGPECGGKDIKRSTCRKISEALAA